MAAEIEIRRPSEGYARLRAYRVLVDGEERARVRRAGSVVFAIEPGCHRLQVRIDWASSPELEIEAADGDRIVLECFAPPLLKGTILGLLPSRRRSVLTLRTRG